MNVDTKTGGFGSSAEFWNAARKSFTGGVLDSRIESLRKATLAENKDSTGGVLVPIEWANEVYAAAMEDAIVRPRAVVLPMSSDQLRVSVLVDGSRATNIFGGVTLTNVSEGGDQYATTAAPTIGSLTLVAHKFVASCFVSNELAADARAFPGFMVQAFGDAVRFLEDDLFINGTGSSGQPLGILNSNALISVTRKSQTYPGAGLVDVADIGGMAARFAPGCWGNAVFLINQSFFTELVNMTAESANPVSVLDLSTMMCLGRPLIVTEHVAKIGTGSEIVLADFSQYIIGDREMRIESSRDAAYSSNTYGFLQDQSCWRLTLRVAGQPIVSAPYTPKRGGSTVAPFVTLATSS